MHNFKSNKSSVEKGFNKIIERSVLMVLCSFNIQMACSTPLELGDKTKNHSHDIMVEKQRLSKPSRQKESKKYQLLQAHKNLNAFEKALEKFSIKALGRITAIQGLPFASNDFMFEQYSTALSRSLIKRSSVLLHDTLSTDKNSQLIIQLNDGSLLLLSPSSKVFLGPPKIEGHLFSIELYEGSIKSLRANNKTTSTALNAIPFHIFSKGALMIADENHFEVSVSSQGLKVNLWSGALKTLPPMFNSDQKVISKHDIPQEMTYQNNRWLSENTSTSPGLSPPLVMAQESLKQLKHEAIFSSPTQLQQLPLHKLKILFEGQSINLRTQSPELILESLVKQEQYLEAYRWSQELSNQWEGTPFYDFWYGLSSTETGHYNEAIFAFERLLMNSEAPLRVHLELAKTHYLSGNFSQAEKHFQHVLDENPPENVKTNIQTFLNRIDRLKQSQAPRFFGLIQGKTGFDSNINSATDEDRIFIPIFNTSVTPSTESQEIDSIFYDIQGLLGYQKPLSKASKLGLTLNLQHKQNLDIDNFDLDILGLSGNFISIHDKNKWSVGGRLQKVWLSYDAYQENVSTSFQWTHQSTVKMSATGQFQWTHSQSDLSKDNDYDQIVLGTVLNYLHQNQLYKLSVNFSRDDYSSSNEYSGKNTLTLGLRLEIPLTQTLKTFSAFSFSQSQYHDENPLFQKTRDDSSFYAQGGIKYQLTPLWQLNSDLSWNKTDSNIDFYTHDRFRFQVGFRRLF